MLQALLNLHKKPYPMAHVHLSTEDLEKCRQAKTILEKEFSRHHTISWLAREVGTNENKLKKGFKLLHNITIHACVTAIRIEKAKELLECTELPVETIAYKLGLDQSNLIKQFKRNTGFTPKEWRNRKNIDTGYAV
jgi:AraC-like DNA-binding protein